MGSGSMTATEFDDCGRSFDKSWKTSIPFLDGDETRGPLFDSAVCNSSELALTLLESLGLYTLERFKTLAGLTVVGFGLGLFFLGLDSRELGVPGLLGFLIGEKTCRCEMSVSIFSRIFRRFFALICLLGSF